MSSTAWAMQGRFRLMCASCASWARCDLHHEAGSFCHASKHFIPTFMSHVLQGASGSVHFGYWRGQRVAVKHIRTQLDDTCVQPQQLRAAREAALGAQLDHPRIVRTLAHYIFATQQTSKVNG